MKPIFSDDPQAIEKLHKKLEYLEHNHATMKRINQEYRINPVEAHLHSEAYNIKTWGKPYPSWMLTNNSAVIRATKQRLLKLAGVKNNVN